MYETIKRLYLAGKLTDKGLASAIGKGWITQAQADSLTAQAEQTDSQKEEGDNG